MGPAAMAGIEAESAMLDLLLRKSALMAGMRHSVGDAEMIAPDCD